MTITSDLILSEALELQRLTLDPRRAAELAEEVRALVDNALRAGEGAEFDDEPDRFLYVLLALRDEPLR